MDCHQLLQFATASEQNNNASNQQQSQSLFGHPDPPRLMLHAHAKSKNVTLAVAYTPHTVTAQVFGSSSVPMSKPIAICELIPDTNDDHDEDDERITCLEIISVSNGEEEQDAVDADEEESKMTSTGSSDILVEDDTVSTPMDDDNDHADDAIKGSASLLTGRMLVREDENMPNVAEIKANRLAIVLGTTASRVYTVELDNWDSTTKSLQPVSFNDTTVFQIFPHDTDRRDKRRRRNHNAVPFAPTGTVTRLTLHEQHLWITYGDGTLLRLSTLAVLPSTWQAAAARQQSVDAYVQHPIRRCHVALPPAPPHKGNVLLCVVPQPALHPSPLAQLHTTSSTSTTTQVLAFAQEGNDLFPTICVYSSESHHHQQQHHHPTDYKQADDHGNTIPETASVGGESMVSKDATVRSVAHSFVMGALRWGWRSSTPEKEQYSDTASQAASTTTTTTSYYPSSSVVMTEPMEEEEVVVDTPTTPSNNNNNNTPLLPFPSLYQNPIPLYAHVEIHDAPRKIESCTIAINGRYAAAADTLGRVLLLDLCNNQQIVRLWKGYRDVTCGWIEEEEEEDTMTRTTDSGGAGWRHSSHHHRRRRRPLLYLVIHSRQRRTVEVWRIPSGARTHVTAVSKEARLIVHNNTSSSSSSSLARCSVLLESGVLQPVPVHGHGGGGGEDDKMDSTALSTAKSTKTTTTHRRRAAQRLQHLQQLLSSSYSKEDVRKALQDIRSLSDLSAALDLLSVNGVGADFCKEAIAYCRGVLNAALHRNKSRDVTQNPHVQLLTHKLEYHTQIVRAFDCLYKFENAKSSSTAANADPMYNAPVVLSTWASEAMSWATTYEKVTKEKLDRPDGETSSKLLFEEFAAACVFPDFAEREKPPLKVYFSDSSRTRREIVANVFRPLLADVFSFNVVYAVFDSLGIRADCKYIEKCFGEWFMTLSIEDVYRKGLNAENPPMVRLLQDLVARQLSTGPIEEHTVALEELHSFCCKSQDLVRSFLLGTMCLNAVTRAAGQKEKWSYGKVSTAAMVENWIVLLRKLRVCLLVSLRMHGKRLNAPVTIENVEQPDIFSVYEWLARDELTVGQSHEEIVALEQTCKISSHSFDPSTEQGDGPSRFRVLQSSCLAASISEDERAEYLVDVDRFGVLLLFMSKFNQPIMLAAHRALIEALDWGVTPSNLDLMRNSLETLKSLREEHKTLAGSVGLEIWQSQLCPILRAHLFGFHDVQELSEEVIAPLLQDQEWVTTVGRLGLELLEVIQTCSQPDPNEEELFGESSEASETPQTWPPPRPDWVLRKLVAKVPRHLDPNAVGAHSVVVCALLVSGDIKTLVSCVPSIYDLFQPNSLFEPVATSPHVSELQESYLNDALINYARQYTGPIMEKFELSEIETLANVWSFDLKRVNARFLRVMYEIGKDEIVDELITNSSSQIDVHSFVEGGLDVACRRLNVFLTGRNARSTLGLLDAEMCSWIAQRTKRSTPLVDSPELHMPIGNTHLFIMRLLTLSAGSNIESPIRVKIHSLSVLSGILIKALAQTSSVS